jgi:hypothetical protein
MGPELIQTPVTSTAQAGEPRKRRGVVAGGSAAALGGEIAVALAVLSLVGVVPWILVPVAALVVGVALLFGGGVVAALFEERLERIRASADARAVVGGMALEGLCGAAGVTLGILALAEILPAILLPLAVIALGGALLLGSGALYFMHPQDEPMIAFSGTQMLAGVGAVVLGVLALVGVPTLALCAVGVLVLGAGLMVGGSGLLAHAWSVRRT